MIVSSSAPSAVDFHNFCQLNESSEISTNFSWFLSCLAASIKYQDSNIHGWLARYAPPKKTPRALRRTTSCSCAFGDVSSYLGSSVACGEAEGGNSYLTPKKNEIHMTPKNHRNKWKGKSSEPNLNDFGFQWLLYLFQGVSWIVPASSLWSFGFGVGPGVFWSRSGSTFPAGRLLDYFCCYVFLDDFFDDDDDDDDDDAGGGGGGGGGLCDPRAADRNDYDHIVTQYQVQVKHTCMGIN